MSDTPRTDAVAGWPIANLDGKSASSNLLADPKGIFVHAVFARELERENTHLLVLATNAEFDRSKLERELAESKAENARLRESGKALRDALAFECHKLGDCPREIDAWDALAKAGYSL